MKPNKINEIYKVVRQHFRKYHNLPTSAELGYLMGVSHTSGQNYYRCLEEHGLVKRVKVESGDSYVYRFAKAQVRLEDRKK